MHRARGWKNLGVAASNRRRTVHGWANTKLAKVYDGMKARCHSRLCAGFVHYGDRGITVCEEWLEDRASFFKWAEASGYAPGLQIDRIDGNKGYSPDNCRWVTQLVNQNNRRSNRRVTFKGETLTMAEWSRKTGISQRVIQARLNAGRSAEEVLHVGYLPHRCRQRT